MKLSSRTLSLLVAIAALLLASIACQSQLNRDESSGGATDVQQSDEHAQPPPEATATPTQAAPTPEPTPKPARLSGLDLPDLAFGPPGESPIDDFRPELSGQPQSLDTEHFRVHYTLSGSDAVPPADENGNLYPDYVEEVARALEYAWFAEVEYFGWVAPPADEALGGNSLYDVYLVSIYEEEDTSGYVEADFESTYTGDNPNSSIVETRADSSFMVIDNDYSDYYDFQIGDVDLIQYMRSTVAHEFLHSIQYGYDSEEPHDWIWEASAHWMQDEILDTHNDNIDDLDAVFKSPDTCILAYGGEERAEDENHWYGLWIFFRFLSERHGHEAVRAIWEAAATLDGYAIWDEVLARQGSTLDELFRNYSIALLTRDFEEGASYPTLRLQGEVGVDESFDPEDGVGQLAADYVEIIASEIISVSLPGADVEGILVGIADGLSAIFPLSNGEISVNAADYEQLFLVVLNLKRASSDADCSFAAYTIDVASGASPASPSDVLPAPNFIAPGLGSIGPEEAPPDLLLVYIPAGYEFFEAYEQSRDEFWDQDLVDLYIPGPGPVTVLVYYGDNDEDFVSVYASDSPFVSLDGYLADIDYEPLPGEILIIEGVTVLLQDWSDESGNFSSATMMLNDFFVVIEGTISVAEMETVVRSWLAG